MAKRKARKKPKSKSVRMTFTMPPRTMDSLRELAESGECASLAAAARRAIGLAARLRGQRAAGYTELIVRDPATGNERVLLLEDDA